MNDVKQYTLTAGAIKTICQMGAVAMCDMMGLNTRLSYSRAVAEYGQFFKEMVRTGRISPVRVGKGKNGIHWYSVSDILALRAEEEAKAKLL